MRTIIKETTLYQFDELTPKAQEKAIEKLWDINVDHDWWDYMYEDAATIGLKITGFDLDRNRHATGEWLWSALETANKIMDEHGENCDTYSTVNEYLCSRAQLVRIHGNGTDQVTEDNEYQFDSDCDDLDREFLRSLLEDYSLMLQKEYEYLTSEEAIKETIQANEYEFTANSDLY